MGGVTVPYGVVREIVRIRVDALKEHKENLKSFVKEPKGVLEWVDKGIKIFRKANRDTIRAIIGG